MKLRNDERGLALALVKFVFILVIGAMLFVLFDAAASQLFTSTLDQTSNSVATTEINNAKGVWGLILFVVVLFAGLYLVMKAVNEQRIGGGR